MRLFLKLFAFSIVAVLLSGCASQQMIPMDSSYWEKKDKKVGVVLSDMPTPTGHKGGNQGLLDLAINEGIGNKLDNHIESLSLSDFDEAAQVIVSHLKRQGIDAIFIEKRINIHNLSDVAKPESGFAKKDFGHLKVEYDIDQLLIIEVKSAGTYRTYYGFIPTSDPQGYMTTNGRLVDLNDNKLLWYIDDKQLVPVVGPWDQPEESWPNLTNAIFKAVENAKTSVIQSFIQ